MNGDANCMVMKRSPRLDQISYADQRLGIIVLVNVRKRAPMGAANRQYER